MLRINLWHLEIDLKGLLVIQVRSDTQMLYGGQERLSLFRDLDVTARAKLMYKWNF